MRPEIRFEPVVGPRIRLTPMTMAQHAQIAAGEREAIWSPGFPTPGDVLLARIAVEFGHLPMAWTIDFDGLVVGGIGVTGFESAAEVGPREELGSEGPDLQIPEIGYGLAVEAQGRGLATEAVEVLVAHLLGDPAVIGVIATTDPGNEASCNVLRRAGFSASGSLDEKDLWLRRPGHDERGSRS